MEKGRTVADGALDGWPLTTAFWLYQGRPSELSETCFIVRDHKGQAQFSASEPPFGPVTAGRQFQQMHRKLLGAR